MPRPVPPGTIRPWRDRVGDPQTADLRVLLAIAEAGSAAAAAKKDKGVQEPVDIIDLVGGPERPLELDEQRRTRARTPFVRPSLPLIGVTDATPQTPVAVVDERPA
jgi:hypothetical protein